MKLQNYNYLLMNTHHAKFHFDPMTCVVSGIRPTQFATVMLLSLSFFFGLFVTRTGRTGGPTFTTYTS